MALTRAFDGGPLGDESAWTGRWRMVSMDDGLAGSADDLADTLHLSPQSSIRMALGVGRKDIDGVDPDQGKSLIEAWTSFRPY